MKCVQYIIWKSRKSGEGIFYENQNICNNIGGYINYDEFNGACNITEE